MGALTELGFIVHHGAALAWRRVRRDERAEGVISAAIAVLIMAFLGAAMWLAFSGTMNKAQTKVDDNVGNIGSDNSGGSAGSPSVGGTGSGTP